MLLVLWALPGCHLCRELGGFTFFFLQLELFYYGR